MFTILNSYRCNSHQSKTHYFKTPTVCCTVLVALCLIHTASAIAASNPELVPEMREFNSHTPIPHSDITQHDGSGIVKAMLSCATERYAHGVLGDAIEAGCLVVEDDTGSVYKLDLPESQVFEDLIPRIADVNADGQNDVVVVRSEQGQGASLAVYHFNQSGSKTQLSLLVDTPPIGTGNRWLAPVGIADFTGDGVIDVAYVQTPHIGGILRVWSIIDDVFVEIAQSRGFSNHRIGDTRVSTSKLADTNNDGVIDIALPDQRRNNTVWVTLSPKFSVLESKPFSLRDFD